MHITSMSRGQSRRRLGDSLSIIIIIMPQQHQQESVLEPERLRSSPAGVDDVASRCTERFRGVCSLHTEFVLPRNQFRDFGDVATAAERLHFPQRTCPATKRKQRQAQKHRDKILSIFNCPGKSQLLSELLSLTRNRERFLNWRFSLCTMCGFGIVEQWIRKWLQTLGDTFLPHTV